MSASSQMPASPTSATAAPPVPATATTLSALKTGARYAQPRPPGSGDAWLLADLARQAGGPLVILTAEPLEAQRLAEEIQLFAPNLSVRQLPDWETLPYDAFSPHQDLISERLHTLHALMTKSVDVLTVPVTTALYRLAPLLPGRLHLLVQAEGPAGRGRAARSADVGELQPRHPGHRARRVLPARRADRPVPDGLGPAVPAGPVRRRDRDHPQLRRRYPAQPVSGGRGAPVAGPRVPHG